MRRPFPDRAWGARAAFVVVALALLVTDATSARPAPAPTIQRTMAEIVDPAADALWDAVGTTETAQGDVRKAPKTEREWLRAAAQARTLIGGARRLQRPGLPVGGSSHAVLADASIAGTRTAGQIRADIDRDPARFRRAADRLAAGGRQALSAILARNPDGLIVAGAAIDAACEACHAAYWYPRTRLSLPSRERFGQIARRP